jgi:hypothetical protein
MDSSDEQQHFLSEGEIVYLPYGKELSSVPKQNSMDSNDGDFHDYFVKLKNSKHEAQFLLTNHTKEVSHYQSPDKKHPSHYHPSNLRFQPQIPDRNTK